MAIPLLQRHPGLAYGDSFSFSNAANSGVTAVSWLTLLGPRLSEKLGGLGRIKRGLTKGVAALPVGAGGVALRAGEKPELGDRERGDLLPEYHAVGKLVAPHRASDDALEDVLVGMLDKDARAWLCRFFEERKK